MNPIDKQFTYNGFLFNLVKRQGRIAIFAKTKPTWTKDFYEVVILQRLPEMIWPDGHVTPAREALPRSEAWGDSGWSYASLSSAMLKLSELIERPNLSTPFPVDASDDTTEPDSKIGTQ